jgi:hypothetical protein
MISDLLEEPPKAVSTALADLAPIESPGDLERYKKAYSYHSAGIPVKNIAETFGVAPSTIYAWIAKYREEFGRQLTAAKRTSLLFDRMQFATLIRDTALADAHQITVDAVYRDPISGKITQGKLDGPLRKARTQLLKLALEADDNLFTMLHRTGVLPSAPKELHCTVSATNPDEKVIKPTEHRSAAEVKASVLQLLNNSRVIQVDLPDEIEISKE